MKAPKQISLLLGTLHPSSDGSLGEFLTFDSFQRVEKFSPANSIWRLSEAAWQNFLSSHRQEKFLLGRFNLDTLEDETIRARLEQALKANAALEIFFLEGRSEKVSPSALSLLNEILGRQKTITLSDSRFRESLSENIKLPKEISYLPGGVFAHQRERLPATQERILFVSPSDPLTQFGGRRSAEWLRKLGRFGRPLLLSQRREHVEDGHLFSADNFYCPQFPMHSCRAIVSSKFLIAFELELVLLARAHGVPALWIVDGERNAATAREMGIPALRWGDWNTNSADLVWQTLSQTSPRAPSAKKHVAIPTKSRSKSNDSVDICILANEKYSPYLAPFILNASEVIGKALHIHFLALDRFNTAAALEAVKDVTTTVYHPEEIFEPDDLKKLQRHPFPARAYASKGAFVLEVMKRTGRTVIYSDLDIYFFEPPTAFLEAARGRALTVVPSWEGSLSGIHRRGLYCAGFFGASPSSDSFVRLWKELVLWECGPPVTRAGFQDDQGLLDLACVFCDSLFIDKTRRDNIGTWSEHSLKMTLPDRAPWRPHVPAHGDVITFHCASEDTQGMFEVKYQWDALVAHYCVPPSQASRKILFELLLKCHFRRSVKLSRFLLVATKIARRFPSFNSETAARLWLHRYVQTVFGTLLKLKGKRSTEVSANDSDDFHWLRILEKVERPEPVAPGVEKRKKAA